LPYFVNGTTGNEKSYGAAPVGIVMIAVPLSVPAAAFAVKIEAAEAIPFVSVVTDNVAGAYAPRLPPNMTVICVPGGPTRLAAIEPVPPSISTPLGGAVTFATRSEVSAVSIGAASTGRSPFTSPHAAAKNIHNQIPRGMGPALLTDP
jgi:hypothetical protein